jgi:hypothetical protein
VSLADTVAALTTPEQLVDLLDADVMWYSADVDSSCTCNCMEDAVACIERNVARGLTGRWDIVGEIGDAVVVRPVLDPPRSKSELSLLLRFRDDRIVEMRDFATPAAALRYAGMR